MSWLRLADASMVWALELARIYLAVLAVQRQAGPRGLGWDTRGVNDAVTGDIVRTDHRVNSGSGTGIRQLVNAGV